MNFPGASLVSLNVIRASAIALLATCLSAPDLASAQAKKTAPAPKAAAPKAAAPAKPSTPAGGGHSPTNTAAGGHSPTNTASGHSPTSAGSKPTPGTTRTAGGGTKTVTASGKEVTKSPTGHVTAVKTASGHEAKFDSKGNVKEVHAGNVTVSHGPNGQRRTEIERADHSRVVAYGHGRGYVEHRYEYGGHPYYARGYYSHGGYYRGYYSGYYYGGTYLYGYQPAYFYPAAYYGWAYNPWPAPAPYAWGWGAAPWYGYYGAYFAPYPVYPSAAFWIADYMVAASLQAAYAAAAAGNAAGLRNIDPAHLVYASYDPATGTTSPTMTKEVKDAVADEIKLELAAGQKTADSSESNAGSLKSLLSDGKPHVFVASAGLTLTSSGTDSAETEGDVLALNTPPAADATNADLRVLASKQNECAKGDVVSVQLTDLQEMHNNLLSNIDKGMAEMKDHPGQGGLPAPPAGDVAGTKQAPYAAAAPPADPKDAADVDQAAQEGAQTEKQVVAEANAPDGSTTAAQPSQSPIGGLAPAAQAAPAQPTGPITIAVGQTPEQVIAEKGQPTSKVNLATKTIFNYPDMKIIFVKGKVSDVQ
jgi:hypothetical protein